MLAKRYAPFAAVVLAQLAVIVLAPSRGTSSVDPFAAGQASSGSSAFGAPGVPEGPGTDPLADGTEPEAGAAPGVAGVSDPTGATPVTPGASGAAPETPGAAPVVAVAGDTGHCVRGRQFGDYGAAPPCVARFSGNNGGSTYAGVTGKTIKLVYVREKDNPVVKGLLQSQDLYPEPEDQKRFMQAMEDFINSRYELYGRKVSISFWASPCQAVPPDDSCFRNDARDLVSKEKPFAVVYDNNTNTPAFFDELSKQRVINFGGWHFQDSFSTARRPYHYDQMMGGDLQAQLTGEYWCKKLAKGKARYAGSADLKALPRKAAIFHAQTEVTTEPAQRLAGILRGCGVQVELAPYSPDTATASQQATSQVAKIKGAGVTSVMFFSDAIAPAFFTKAMTQQTYFPEHVLVGSGLVDFDKVARLYDPQQWKNAFGPSDTIVYPSFDKLEASIVWRATGRTGVPYSNAQLPWSYWTSVAGGLQMAGAQLDPGTFERTLLSGSIDTRQYAQSKNPNLGWTHFGRDDYTAVSDAKEAYWDADATSTVDGTRGAYRSLNNGARFAIGQWPRGESTFPIGG